MKVLSYITAVTIMLVINSSTLLAGNRIPEFSGDKSSSTASSVQSKTVYTCPMHPDVIREKPGKCPECGMNLVVKEAAKDVYTCPMHPDVVQDKPGKCPECGMNLVKKEAVKESYTCPMHPDVVQDKPGKCPKCGMNLVRKTQPKSK